MIETTPPGAKVYVNDQPVGYAPVEVPFTYYGIYRITLELDNHQTLQVDQKVTAPWYAYPPIDFLAEHIYPFKASDIKRFQFDLAPMPRQNHEELRYQAEELRKYAKDSLPEPSIPYVPKNPNPPMPAPRIPVKPVETLPPPVAPGP